MRNPAIRTSSLYQQRPTQTEAWRRHVHGDLVRPSTCKLCRIFWCAVASWVVVGVAARLLGWW
jgi:hypothetical protein